jgi:hypothetical protein
MAFNAMKQQVHDYLHQPDDSPDTKPFSMKELKSALKKLHDKCAPGDDNIFAEALHCLHEPLTCSLSHSTTGKLYLGTGRTTKLILMLNYYSHSQRRQAT